MINFETMLLHLKVMYLLAVNFLDVSNYEYLTLRYRPTCCKTTQKSNIST